MSTKLSDDLKQALSNHPPGQPLPVRDDETQTEYVLVRLELFERMRQALGSDVGELTEKEMMAASEQRLEDPEGWGAPGMEVYDDYHPPRYDPPRKNS